MTKYIPFLKAKQNEIKAMSELALSVRGAICPFFDFPKKNGGYSKVEFFESVKRINQRLVKNIGKLSEFYFDNFDIEEPKLLGKDSYDVLMQEFSSMNVIPVLGLDRTIQHNQSVATLKSSGKIKSKIVALRVCPEDFESFDLIEDDIEDNLRPIFDLFDKIDLVLDCRVCAQAKVSEITPLIQQFSQKFCQKFVVRRVILTGSSIPASIRDILKVESEHIVDRRELEVFASVKAVHSHARLIFGDYTTVSPHYSDVDMPPEMLQNVMTAKLTYTIPGGHYFIRGKGLKTNGPQQYFRMAKTLCEKPFFRGDYYSNGDAYFASKSLSQGSNCTPNAVIKPSVIAHISYMVLNAGL